MASPICPHCKGRSFALSTIEPVGAQYKANLIICNQCDAPVGAMEYYDAGVLLKAQEKLLKKMEKTLADLEGRLRRVEQYAAAAANR
jgi:hypothetical protein